MHFIERIAYLNQNLLANLREESLEQGFDFVDRLCRELKSVAAVKICCEHGAQANETEVSTGVRNNSVKKGATDTLTPMRSEDIQMANSADSLIVEVRGTAICDPRSTHALEVGR